MATPSDLQMNVRVTVELRDALDRLVADEAERTGYKLGRSEVVRRMLELVLADPDPLAVDELRAALAAFRASRVPVVAPRATRPRKRK